MGYLFGFLKGRVIINPQEIGPDAGTFFWRFALIFFLPGRLAAIVAIPAILSGREASLALLFPVARGGIALMTAFFGTQLPAIIDGKDKSWGAAALVVHGLLGLPTQSAVTGEVDWAGIPVMVVLTVVGAFLSVMVAVIIALPYRQTERAA